MKMVSGIVTILSIKIPREIDGSDMLMPIRRETQYMNIPKDAKLNMTLLVDFLSFVYTTIAENSAVVALSMYPML